MIKTNFSAVPKPVKRGAFRLSIGKIYHTSARYLHWMFGGIKFARLRDDDLRYTQFTHATPLFRKLKDVDMYLQHNKAVNLKIAAKKVNGITIYPGETFSYWKAIGRPTKRKGYLEGMVLKNGTFEAGVGGGLCQFSNLIYWMALHTPLTVTERHRHSYDVFPDSNRTLPFGSGATCFYNYKDLMIKNNTDRPFKLTVEITESELKGAFMSDRPADCQYEVYEKDHLIQSEYWGGYSRHNSIYRKTVDSNGDVISNDLVTENHALMMYSPLLSNPALK